MHDNERMESVLNAWGLFPQVQELMESGFTHDDAVRIVYKAHINGNAYNAAQITGK